MTVPMSNLSAPFVDDPSGAKSLSTGMVNGVLMPDDGNLLPSRGVDGVMTEDISDNARLKALQRIGPQPIVLAAIAFAVMVAGIGSIFAWRNYSGTTPEQDRVVSGRLVQTRVAQASEQLVEKTKDLEASQQQSIDQLQVVQDQLQAIQQALTAQRTETKRLAEQVGGLSSALESMRDSFASLQASEVAAPAIVRSKPARHRVSGRKSRASASAHKRGKSRG